MGSRASRRRSPCREKIRPDLAPLRADVEEALSQGRRRRLRARARSTPSRTRSREILGAVVAEPPTGGNDEGEEETEKVQEPVAPEPGGREDAGVEKRVITEEGHMASLTRGGEDRSEEAADGRERRERERVLGHREHRRERHEQEEKGEGHRSRDQRIEAEGGEDGEIEDADASSLKSEPETRTRGSRSPAEDQKRYASERGTREPELDGKERALDRVLQEEGDAEEKDHHSHGDDEAWPREVGFRPAPDAIEEVRPSPFRLRPSGFGGTSP